MSPVKNKCLSITDKKKLIVEVEADEKKNICCSTDFFNM
jgi:hypothetical protein